MFKAVIIGRQKKTHICFCIYIQKYSVKQQISLDNNSIQAEGKQ